MFCTSVWPLAAVPCVRKDLLLRLAGAMLHDVVQKKDLA
jgi:hypothetical protein